MDQKLNCWCWWRGQSQQILHKVFFTKFKSHIAVLYVCKLEQYPHLHGSGSAFRKNSWIWICKNWMRIQSPGLFINRNLLWQHVEHFTCIFLWYFPFPPLSKTWNNYVPIFRNNEGADPSIMHAHLANFQILWLGQEPGGIWTRILGQFSIDSPIEEG